MTIHAQIGMNRTGIATAPELSAEMIDGTLEFSPSGPGDGSEVAAVRRERARVAEPLGHVPPPLNVKGIAKTTVQALKGNTPSLFVDKIGERLGFERTGVRLYDALLSKFDAGGAFAGGPSRGDLEDIRAEEFAHFKLLQAAAKKLGADPTVLTPSADLHATITRGALEVMVDARTNLAQCLEAALVVELADNDSWQSLLALARKSGEDELGDNFTQAILDEQRHLALVRQWLAEAQGRD